MKWHLSTFVKGVVAATLFSVAATVALGQITITLPKIPKIKKTQPTPTPAAEISPAGSTNTTTTSTASSSGESTASTQAKTDCSRGAVGVHMENLQTTIDQAREFRLGRDYFVRDFNDDENMYLKAALSDGRRKKWLDEWNDPEFSRCIGPKLDELAEVASKTIVGYKPVGYTFGTPAEKNILKRGVTDLAEATVYAVGLNSANWKIITNDFGIPTRRKKFGTLWVKYPNDKYCKIIYVNLIQNYAGGGTYNASEYQFISWEFAGCPAGK